MGQAWEPALLELVAERYGRLVARAMVLTGSRQDAEDLVQDALVRVFAGRARFEAVEAAEQYVRRTIASRFIDRRRTAKRERLALARTAEGGDPPDGRLRSEVETAMAGLAPRARACVYLRHLEGLSVAETAAVLGLSEGAVKRYTSDGMSSLAATLGAMWRPSDGSVPVVPSREGGRDA